MCHSLAALQPAKTNEKRGKTIEKYHQIHISTSTGLQFDPACLMSSELICLLGADDFAFGPDCYVSAALLLELHIILLLLCVCWDRARCTISLQEVSESEVSVFCLLLLRGCFKLLVLRECYSPRAGYHCYSWTATRHLVLVEGLHTSMPLSLSFFLIIVKLIVLLHLFKTIG